MPRVCLSRASFFFALTLAATTALTAAPVGAASPESSEFNPHHDNARQQIAAWLSQLGDRDPQMRAAARQGLMALSPAELPMLRDAVAHTARLTPAQADPLESIVTYISTRGALLDLQQQAQRQDQRQEPPQAQSQATSDLANPFLGITLAPRPAEQADGQDQTIDVGVTVAARLFGFVAYRYLEDGDVILALGTGNNLKITRNNQELMSVIHTFAPGERVTLSLLRGGRVMQTQFALDVAPQASGDRTPVSAAQLESSIDRLRSDAQDYWDRDFAGLVAPPEIGATAELNAGI